VSSRNRAMESTFWYGSRTASSAVARGNKLPSDVVRGGVAPDRREGHINDNFFTPSCT
jgi:hypothetical protein